MRQRFVPPSYQRDLRKKLQHLDQLKIAMRQRFVPPSYQRDLRKKLQHLDQGDMSVQDYYAEL
jgi:hypothetical protein